ncbi:basic helix-loop-helix and HMG box domain-containing protein 1-like [Trachemys scripta elegans]|uniref:basic helix-loop-helix and HMG box domain-containing protein 1-like n=1 Tax=Trachemys scripta elegans TaxID=31138 RepID=UPI001557A24B|nr:basic helix-loop-helix and HMG box domain-containing protein 1-like [Trachemys scripta elegans]
MSPSPVSPAASRPWPIRARRSSVLRSLPHRVFARIGSDKQPGLSRQMWGQVGRAGPWEPRPGRSSCQPRTIGDGKRRGNYTNTLRELTQMLPVPLHTSYKKLTKKEILLRVLRYIEHLQASISTARTLLQLRHGEKEEFGAGASTCAEMSACQRGCRDGTPPVTPRRRRAKLLNVGKKPCKGKRSRRSGWDSSHSP